MITEEHLPALQGMFPSWITTCSAAGEPNTTVISQVWYVDEEHVALSFQFFQQDQKEPRGKPQCLCDHRKPGNDGDVQSGLGVRSLGNR